MHSRRLAAAIPLAFLVAGLFAACASAAPRGTPEARTAARLDSLRAYPGELRAFLRLMPKGGDLHNHLSGAIYAESFAAWAAEAGLCATQDGNLVPPPCKAASGQRPVSDVANDPEFYARLVNAWSMRGFVPGAPFAGHAHFFGTFGKFDPADNGRTGDMLAEAVSRAARGKVSYLELMQTLDGGMSMGIGLGAGWDDDLEGMRKRLEAAGIGKAVLAARERARRAEAAKDSLLACGTEGAKPGCGVTVRWLYQVLREGPPERVFAQILTGFLLAADTGAGFVGLNLVQPEDGYYSMRDYSLHMRMIGYLRTVYPDVKVTLHAGELAPGLVPPEGLAFHIGEAVRVAGARRIGHGVAVMHEDDPYGLLREMRERGVLVEICLTSNDGILGVRGAEHPLRTYRNHGVPVALATDDEGVSRSDLTQEFFRAATEQGLGYRELKEMARNSLRYAFVEEPVKARLLEALERDFEAFEGGQAFR